MWYDIEVHTVPPATLRLPQHNAFSENPDILSLLYKSEIRYAIFFLSNPCQLCHLASCVKLHGELCALRIFAVGARRTADKALSHRKVKGAMEVVGVLNR